MKKEKFAAAVLRGVVAIALASVFTLAVAFLVYVMAGYVIPSTMIMLVGMTGVGADENVMNAVFVLGMPAIFMVGLYIVATIKSVQYFYRKAIGCYKAVAAWTATKLAKKGA